jgi:hypothetical protein
MAKHIMLALSSSRTLFETTEFTKKFRAKNTKEETVHFQTLRETLNVGAKGL